MVLFYSTHVINMFFVMFTHCFCAIGINEMRIQRACHTNANVVCALIYNFAVSVAVENYSFQFVGNPCSQFIYNFVHFIFYIAK